MRVPLEAMGSTRDHWWQDYVVLSFSASSFASQQLQRMVGSLVVTVREDQPDTYIDSCFNSESISVETPLVPAGAFWSEDVKIGVSHAKSVDQFDLIRPDPKRLLEVQQAILAAATRHSLQDWPGVNLAMVKQLSGVKTRMK